MVAQGREATWAEEHCVDKGSRPGPGLIPTALLGGCSSPRSLLPPPFSIPALIRFESLLLISIFVVSKCVLVFSEPGGSLRAGACPSSSLGLLGGPGSRLCPSGHMGRVEIGAQPQPGLGSEHPVSQEHSGEARKAPGTCQKALWPNTSWGWRIRSGGHLQPPDCDLSQAAPCCSPDLTQALPRAAGRPSPGSVPRRSARFLRPHPDRGRPPAPLGHRGALAGLEGSAEGKGHLLSHWLHPLIPPVLIPFLWT